MSVDLDPVPGLLAEIERLHAGRQLLTEQLDTAHQAHQETVKQLWAAEMLAERRRLAWASASGRAAGLADELAEAKVKLAELSKAYQEACLSLQVYRGDLP